MSIHVYFYFQLFLASKDLPKFEQTLNAVEPMKQEYVTKANSVQKREIVRIFSGFLKVYYYIITGRVCYIYFSKFQEVLCQLFNI